MNIIKGIPLTPKTVKCLAVMLGVCLFSVPLRAQETVVANALVKAAITESEIANIAASDPNGVLYLNYLTVDAWYIADIPSEKTGQASSLPYLHRIDRKSKTVLDETLDATDLPIFNILEYDYKISTSRTYYRIANSDQMLVLKSHEEITSDLNKIKK